MPIVLGGTGNVGSAVVTVLLQAGEPVTIVTHDPEKVAKAQAQHPDAKIAVVDVREVHPMRRVLQRVRCLFLLNPLATRGTTYVASAP